MLSYLKGGSGSWPYGMARSTSKAQRTAGMNLVEAGFFKSPAEERLREHPSISIRHIYDVPEGEDLLVAHPVAYEGLCRRRGPNRKVSYMLRSASFKKKANDAMMQI